MPAPVWQIHHPTQGYLDCVIAGTSDGQVRVAILHGGKEQMFDVVPEAPEAIRWAEDIYRTFVD